MLHNLYHTHTSTHIRISLQPWAQHPWRTPRVGHNPIYTMYKQKFWQGNRQIYGHIRCIYTLLANLTHSQKQYTACLWPVIWGFLIPGSKCKPKEDSASSSCSGAACSHEHSPHLWIVRPYHLAVNASPRKTAPAAAAQGAFASQAWALRRPSRALADWHTQAPPNMCVYSWGK